MSLDEMDKKLIHLDKVLAFILGNIWSLWAWKSDYFGIAKGVALLVLMMSEKIWRLLVINACKKAQLILSKDQELCMVSRLLDSKNPEKGFPTQ